MGRMGRDGLSNLKGEFKELTCPWTIRRTDPLFPFCMWKGNVFGVLTLNQLNLVTRGYPPCPRATAATALLVKATEEIGVGSPLTIVPMH